MEALLESLRSIFDILYIGQGMLNFLIGIITILPPIFLVIMPLMSQLSLYNLYLLLENEMRVRKTLIELGGDYRAYRFKLIGILLFMPKRDNVSIIVKRKGEKMNLFVRMSLVQKEDESLWKVKGAKVIDTLPDEKVFWKEVKEKANEEGVDDREIPNNPFERFILSPFYANVMLWILRRATSVKVGLAILFFATAFGIYELNLFLRDYLGQYEDLLRILGWIAVVIISIIIVSGIIGISFAILKRDDVRKEVVSHPAFLIVLTKIKQDPSFREYLGDGIDFVRTGRVFPYSYSCEERVDEEGERRVNFNFPVMGNGQTVEVYATARFEGGVWVVEDVKSGGF
ncbi:MAG: hypothetical protein AAF740_05730 [Bacteroidota bacterium]